MFIHPSTILVAGPTQCGKTYFVRRVLTSKNISPFPDKIIWAYGANQPVYNEIKKEMSNIEFVEGMNEEKLNSLNPRNNNLLVLDDLMSELGKTETLSNIFTKISHHKNLSVIYIVQNIFDKGQAHRACSLNSHYIVLFKNKRDVTQADILGRQIIANKKFKLSSALNDAASDPHGYLLIDLRKETPDDYKLRTFIFPGEDPRVYIAPN